LAQLIDHHASALLGRAHAVSGRFPLLIKYLDAAENLSVQVHPTADYARLLPVVAAAPGSSIYRGVHPAVTPAQFRAAIADGSAVDLLIREQVAVGDCIPLESGLCHALGAGVMVAEVQTPSDTTFRVFDWNRNDPARPLHIAQAMECILFGAAQRLPDRPITSIARANPLWSDGLRAAMLCANDFFELEAIEASPSGDAAPMACTTDNTPVIMMPADLVPTTLDLGPGAMLLRAVMPDPARRIGDTPPPGVHIS
jgi:mannose-6-phosphate isomerase class I